MAETNSPGNASDNTAGGMDRRSMLRRSAVGAGAAAAAVAAPGIVGLGVAPAFAAVGSPGEAVVAMGVTDLTIAPPANPVGAGAALVCGPIIDALQAGDIVVPGIPLSANGVVDANGDVAIAPGDLCLTVDACSLFNAQLAGALAGLPAGIALADFGISIGGTVTVPVAGGAPISISIPTIALPPAGAPFDQPLAPCPQDFCNTAPVTIPQGSSIGPAAFAGNLSVTVSIGAPFLCTVDAPITGTAPIPADFATALGC